MRHWYWMIPLLLLTFWLGAAGLGADGIWYDEWRTVYRAGGAQYGPLSFVGILERMLAEDPNQSLGYPMLIAGWGALVGWSDVAVRAFSLLAGIVVVAVIYRLGHEMDGARSGLIAALVMGTSAFFVYYLHEMRTYTIYTLFAALSLWSYWRVIRVQWGWDEALGLTLSIAGMLYMHYLGALLVIGVGMYHLLFVAKDRRWWQVTGAAMLGGVLFMPWARMMLEAVNRAIEEGGRPTISLALGEILPQLSYAFTNGIYVVLVPVVIGGGLAMVRPTYSGQRQAAGFVGFVAIVTLAATYALHAWLDVLSHMRYLLTLWLPLTLLAGIGAMRMGQLRVLGVWWAPVIAGLSLVSGVWYSFDPAFQDRLVPDSYNVFFRPGMRWDALGEILHHESVPSDAVAFSTARHAWAVQGSLAYYLNGIPARYTLLNQLDADNTRRSAYRFVAGAPRVWFGTEYTDAPPENRQVFQSILDGDYIQCDTPLTTPSLRLDRYAVIPACCTQPVDVLVNYNQRVQLAAFTVLTQPELQRMKPVLGWAIDPDFPINMYSVAIHLVDAMGEIAFQWDMPLPTSAYSCQMDDFDLDELAVGDYSLKLTVYNWQTGERLNSGSGEGQITLGLIALSDGGVEWQPVLPEG